MKPYYEEAGITIYHGDCRDVLPQMPLVNLVITDPPYGVGFDYGDTLARKDHETGYIEWLWPTLEIAEGLVSDGHVLVFQSAKHCRKWADWFPRDWSLIALPKSFVQIYASFILRSTDYCLFWGVGDAPTVKQDWQPSPARDWFLSYETAIPALRADHPCPRPGDTMRNLVRVFVPPGALILDPFMGSGTTLRAAKDLGRRAIGIEIEEKYCEIAAKRLAQGVLDFGAP